MLLWYHDMQKPWHTSPKSYEKTFQQAIQCNCRKCRGENGSQAHILLEKLREKDTVASKSTKKDIQKQAKSITMIVTVTTKKSRRKEKRRKSVQRNFLLMKLSRTTHQKMKMTKKTRLYKRSLLNRKTCQEQDLNKLMKQIYVPAKNQKSHLRKADLSARTKQMKNSIGKSWIETA